MREINIIFKKLVRSGNSFLLIVLFSIYFQNAKSQILTDSLVRELDLLAQIDTTKFNQLKKEYQKQYSFTSYDSAQLNELEGNKFHNHGDDFTAKKWYLKANQLAKETKNSKVELSSRIKIIWLELGLGITKLPEAFVRANRLYSDALEIKDTTRMLMALNALANFRNNQGRKEEALNYYYEGLKLSDHKKYARERATLLNNLGLLKSDMGMGAEALNDFREGLHILKNEKEFRLQTRLYNNIAYYFNQDTIHKDSALFYFNKTLELGKLLKEPFLIIAGYTNLAAYQTYLVNFDLANSYNDSALAILENNNMPGVRSKIFIGKAELYKKKQKLDEAMVFLKKGMNYVESEDYDKLEDLIHYSLIFYQIYNLKKNNKKALYHYQKYIAFKDSLRERDDERFLNELNLKYEDEKRIAEIEKQKSRADLAEQKQETIKTELSLKQWRNTLLFSFVLFLIIILFFIYYFRTLNAKKKAEKKYTQSLISEIEEERQRISSDLHDHIGLNLILVKNKLNQSNSDQNLGKDIEKVVDDVRKISKNIFPSQLNKLGIKKMLESTFDKIEEATGILTLYELDGLDQINFSKNEELILFRIIQELSNNSIKHANAKSIKLELTRSEKSIHFHYQDNGIGLEKSKWTGENAGMGLKNIQHRVEKLGGSINFESKKGKGIKVKINLERKNSI